MLDDGPAPGTPLAQVLPLGTDVLELEITPNRPDCLGVYGIAREVHARDRRAAAAPPWSVDPGMPRRRAAGDRGRRRVPASSARASPRACSRA